MIHRVLQFKDEHGWNAEEEAKAFFYLEEGLPIGLHQTGELCHAPLRFHL